MIDLGRFGLLIRFSKECTAALIIIILLPCTKSFVAYANEHTTHGETPPYSLDRWSSNLRWAIDLSTRHNNSLRGARSEWKHIVGLDLHKVFQGKTGDIGTLVFQPYLVKLTNAQNPPFFFDDGDDWELTWRMTNFNYTGLSQGKFNIRVGHFEVPFGLEKNIDTNGTLRQYTFSTRGIKADWGVSINGVLDKFDYEFAVMRGSSNEFTARDDPYVFSGRVGSPENRNLVIGLSAFFGEVLNASGTANRKRIGVDLAYYFYQWEFLLEASGGKDEESDIVNFLAEASWRSPMETYHLYTQLRQNHNKTNQNWNDSTRLSLGMKYDVNKIVSLSGEVIHDIDVMPAVSKQTSLILQLRIRI